MRTYKRKLIEDLEITNPDSSIIELQIKKGTEVETSDVNEEGNLVLFTRIGWLTVPSSLFTPGKIFTE